VLNTYTVEGRGNENQTGQTTKENEANTL